MFLPSTFIQAQRRVSVRLGEKQRTEIEPPVCWGISNGETVVPDLFKERALQYDKWRTHLIGFFLNALSDCSACSIMHCGYGSR